jgi:hypothetical protein
MSDARALVRRHCDGVLMGRRAEVLALACAAALLAGCGSEERATRAGGEAPAALAPVLPHDPWRRADAQAAPETKGRWLTARLQRRVVLRAAPGGRRLAVLRTHTEFGSPTVLAVVARRPGALVRALPLGAPVFVRD